MNCWVCSRSPSPKLPFHCATCARSLIYGLRIELASTLLQKGATEKQINKIVHAEEWIEGGKKGQRDSVSSERTIYNLGSLSDSDAETNDQLRHIKQSISDLKRTIGEQKAAIEERKLEIQRQRENTIAAKESLAREEARITESLEHGIRRAEKRWNHVHDRSTVSRASLCREAADLYGLRHRRRIRADGAPKDEYKLGGNPVIDLRELNNTSPSKITASLGNVAYLVALTSDYLGLRLPAELTLPHKDYPLPTVFPPSSSYQARPQPFPGHTPTQSVSTSPSGSRGELRPIARPRPLYIDKTLPALAKDDPAAYSFFVEGVTYLAWDVAWLCRTQGLDVGSSGWEDVCSMGRNLWQLLVAPPIASQAAGSLPSTFKLGSFSHGSSHTFLGSAEGTQFMKTWRLQSPMQLVDLVKASLLGDMTGAEWEVLEEKEWEDSAKEVSDDGVMIENESYIKSQTPVGDVQHTEAAQDSGRRTEQLPTDRSKGWTKLKSRSEQ